LIYRLGAIVHSVFSSFTIDVAESPPKFHSIIRTCLDVDWDQVDASAIGWERDVLVGGEKLEKLRDTAGPVAGY